MAGLHSKSLSQPSPLPTSDLNPADEPPPYHHPQPRPSATEPPPTTPALPIGAQAVPNHNPGCNYNSQDGVTARDHFATCLITGLRKAAQKAVNFDKLHKIIQEKHENPSAFLARLTQALQQYTNMDPKAPDSRQLLMFHFFAQSFPDIRAKLKKLDRGPFTPQTEILATAFKVYHNRDEQARRQKCQMLAQAFKASTQPIRRHASMSTTHQQPPGPCFKCGNKGHWAHECPNPRPPKRPCPKCQQSSHWVTDCPSSLGGAGPDPILKLISLSWQPKTDGALGPLPDTHHHHAGAQDF
ncbi:uncharacterized protein [Symphalangus syndactylus]|uniref:uncharacterized protein isoform X2 n=1 Tax=Symphalangus syndactylus TaxID=9590 RepID=UPI003006D18D